MKPPRRSCSISALLVLLTLFMAGCNREDLVRVDSEKEANRIVVELADNGIKDARIETSSDRKGSTLITVSHEDLNSAREVLLRENLPRDQTGGFEEMVNQSSLIPSAADDRAKLIRATTGELERTFETYDDVVEARVHVVMPEIDSMHVGAATQPTTASAMVLIKFRDRKVERAERNATTQPNATQLTETGSGDATENAVPTLADVQDMVAGSVEGLRPADVDVKFTRSALRNLPKPGNLFLPEEPNNAVVPVLCFAIGIVLTLMGVATWRLIGRSKAGAREVTTGSPGSLPI